MTREEIIGLALKVGATTDYAGDYCFDAGELERFAALLIANQSPKSSMAYQDGYEVGVTIEREACAKVCDEYLWWKDPADSCRDPGDGNIGCAAAIRARGAS